MKEKSHYTHRQANYSGIPDDPSVEKGLRLELQAAITSGSDYETLSSECRRMFSLGTFNRLRVNRFLEQNVGVTNSCEPARKELIAILDDVRLEERLGMANKMLCPICGKEFPCMTAPKCQKKLKTLNAIALKSLKSTLVNKP